MGTLVAIVTLSAGIGAVSTMYVLFKAATNDLPHVPHVDRIGRVYVTDPAQPDGRTPAAPVERRTWLQSPPRGMTIAVATDLRVFIEPGAQEVDALAVSLSYFSVAQVKPEMGRVFVPGERAIVISKRLWDLLPAENRRLGVTLTVDGDRRALVGVMPASFWMPFRGVDAWVSADEQSDEGWPHVMVRLDEGITPEQGAAELSPVVQHVRGRNYAARIRLLAADAAVRTRTGMLMLVGPALLVLLAVCANVSALLLGDVHRRRRELAVRAALGASRWRLAREVFADAMIIAVFGGVVSVAGAYWSVRALRAAIASVSGDLAAMLPAFGTVAPIALATATAAVLGVGLAPALFASRVRIVSDLAGTSPPLFRKGRYGTADLLLVLQVAMAVGLVVWTAIFANLFKRIESIPAHIPADRLWGIAVTARPGTPALPRDLPSRLLMQVEGAPGIEAAAVVESGRTRRLWTATGAGGSTTCSAYVEHVSGDFFRAQGLPLRGRHPAAGEAILNDLAFVRCANATALRDASPSSESLRVVGTVDDRMMGAGIPGPVGPAQVYVRLVEASGRELALKLRMRAPGATDVQRARDDLVRNFPNIAIGEPRSFAVEHQRQSGSALLVGGMLGILSALALLFGIVGLHGAFAEALTSRTREIGVRMALGAAHHHVIGVTLGHHAVPATLGILLGSAVAIGGLFTLGTDDAALIRRLAWLTAQSPGAWAGLLVLLLASALLSASIPVLRALRLDPAVVLRHE